MKVTVGDVTNNKCDVRQYLGYDEEKQCIYVSYDALDTLLIDKSEEWHSLKRQNKRYREVFDELRNFVLRGEDECNIKQLIMKRCNELEGEE